MKATIKKIWIKIPFILVIALIFFNSKANAQVKSLKEGEYMPSYVFKDIMNYANEELRISDFKGKLVILDFWGVYCIPCLEAFPKLDSLQAEFKDDIQIIAVSKPASDSITRFFNSHPGVYKPSFPFINGDESLQKILPHASLPFHVWIDKEGKLIKAVDGYNLSRQNINDYLKKGSLDMNAATARKYIDVFDPLIKDGINYSSYIYRPRNLSIYPKKPGAGISDRGSAAHLIQRAHDEYTSRKYGLTRPGKLIIELADPSPYIKPVALKGKASSDWSQENIYWYQLVMPNSDKTALYAMMVEDLKRYFPIQAVIEKRKIKCLRLVKRGKIDLLKSKQLETEDSFTVAYTLAKNNPIQRKLLQQPYELFTDRLQSFVERQYNYYFVNDYNYKGLIDIVIDGKVLDEPNLDGLRKALWQYGLDLVEDEVKTDVLVLKDR